MSGEKSGVVKFGPYILYFHITNFTDFDTKQLSTCKMCIFGNSWRLARISYLTLKPRWRGYLGNLEKNPSIWSFHKTKFVKPFLASLS